MYHYHDNKFYPNPLSATADIIIIKNKVLKYRSSKRQFSLWYGSQYETNFDTPLRMIDTFHLHIWGALHNFQSFTSIQTFA